MPDKEKYEDGTHNISNEQLAKMLREIARRHVGLDQEVIYEAANRLEAQRFTPQSKFNPEEFSV